MPLQKLGILAYCFLKIHLSKDLVVIVLDDKDKIMHDRNLNTVLTHITH